MVPPIRSGDVISVFHVIHEFAGLSSASNGPCPTVQMSKSLRKRLVVVKREHPAGQNPGSA